MEESPETSVPRLPSRLTGDIEADYKASMPLSDAMKMALAEWVAAGGEYQHYHDRQDNTPRVRFAFNGWASAAERNHLLDIAHRIGAAGTVATVIETACDPDPNDPNAGPPRPFHRSTADRFIGPSPELRAEIAQDTLTEECVACVNNKIGPRSGDRDDLGSRRRKIVEQYLMLANDWSRAPDWVVGGAFVDPDGDPVSINLGDCAGRWKYLASRALEAARDDLAEPLDLPFNEVVAHANTDTIGELAYAIAEHDGDIALDAFDINTMMAGLDVLQRLHEESPSRAFTPLEGIGLEGYERAHTYDSFFAFRALIADRCGVVLDGQAVQSDLAPSL